MIWYKVPIVFGFVVSYIVLSSCTKESSGKQKFLDCHNIERAKLNLMPLTWSDELAAYAKNYAKKRKVDCELVHSDTDSKYGENIAQCPGELSIEDAVKCWIDEKVDYNYDSNKCAPGKACGHYTQVVWRNTTCLGCSKVRCDSGGTFVTCNYEPPGNYIGEKPY